MKKSFTIIISLILALVLSVLLVLRVIDVSIFTTLAIFLIILIIILVGGIETVTEVSAWKLSIKRDVNAARKIRVEIEGIRNELEEIAKISAENAYILASTSFLAMGGEKPANERLTRNLDRLSKIITKDSLQEEEWWKELEALFADRRKPSN